MAIFTLRCLNLPPSSPATFTPVSRTPKVSWAPRDGSWKNQCLLGVTCAIVGLELGGFAVLGDQETAVAMDVQSGPRIVRVQKWSDERACLPWRANSLETIVPENLPRPSARRRWEATGFSKAAPPVRVAAKSGAKSCFTL